MSRQPSPASRSRRNALIGGAGVIAGSAAAVAGTRLHSPGAEVAATAAATSPDVPVLLRLADARTGAFDVYVGTRVIQLVDNGFALQVARAAGRH